MSVLEEERQRERRRVHTALGLKNPHPGGVPDTKLAAAKRAKFALALPERHAGSVGPGAGRPGGRGGMVRRMRIGWEQSPLASHPQTLWAPGLRPHTGPLGLLPESPAKGPCLRLHSGDCTDDRPKGG